MVSSKYLQSALVLTALQITLCTGARAGETQSGSEASVNPTTSASSGSGTEASQSGSSESSRSSSTQSSSQNGSEAASQAPIQGQNAPKSPSRPMVISGHPSLQQTVNEVSRPDQGVSTYRPAHAHKRAAHWKTQVWNQKSKTKTKTKTR